MIYPRKISSEIQKHLDDSEIIVLTGMRRVGKTTLYQSLFEKIESHNKAFLDLENPITQKVFEEKNFDNITLNLKEFGLNVKEKSYLFLDEIQVIPEITKAIKYLYDHYGIKFFLTGSSSFYLKNLFPESLAGRKFVFHLKPLDFEEFLVFKEIKREKFNSFPEKDKNKSYLRFEKLKGFFEEFKAFGGFPQVVLEEDREKKKLHLQDILKSYFEKDVQNLAKFKEIKTFRDLILLLMSRVGSKLDITRLSSELGTSRETIYSYLSFLENTFFLSLIGPYTKSADRLVAKAKKVYFCDTGLINENSKLTEGQMLENSVFNCLQNYGEIRYYQKAGGQEIDFILDKKIALEVKAKGVFQDLKRLREISNKIGIKNSYIITKEYIKETGYISTVDL